MGERNILAYFKTPEQAQAVADQLKSMGIAEVAIDRFSAYPGGSRDDLMNPITSKLSSQAEITLGNGLAGHDAEVLASADNAASGMSDGGRNAISGRDIVLAAVVDDNVFEQARQVVRENGGLV